MSLTEDEIRDSGNPYRIGFLDGFLAAFEACHWAERMTGSEVDALIQRGKRDALLHLEYRGMTDEQHKAKVGATVLKLFPER